MFNRNLLISLGLLLTLASAESFANHDDVKKAAVSDGEQCVQRCNDYYKSKGHLRAFSYYQGMNIDTKNIMGVLFDLYEKSLYCLTAASSLGHCYEKDSSIYNVCKWVTKKTVENLITSDDKVLAMFSSCKDTCLNDLRKLCPLIL